MSETSFTLKYPNGEFTHSELAKHNGKTNQQVWTRLQAALKSGDLIHTRLRTAAGRGKPSKLYAQKGFVVPADAAIPAPAQPATPPAPSTPAPVVPSEPVETVPTPINTTPAQPAVEASAEDDNVVLPTEAEIEAATAPTAPAASAPVVTLAPILPAVEPAAAPVVVEVARVEAPAPTVEIVSPAVAPVRNLTTPQATEMSETCPVCSSKLFSQPDATGVMVWCAQPLEVCKSTENPFGHGKNAKEAYQTLMEKWTKCMAK